MRRSLFRYENYYLPVFSISSPISHINFNCSGDDQLQFTSVEHCQEFGIYNLIKSSNESLSLWMKLILLKLIKA